MLKPLLTILLLSVSCLSWATDNITDEVPVKPDSYTFNVGAFYANSDSYMVVTNPKNGGNFPLDFESDLNLKETQFLPFFEFVYSFNQRHNFYVDWKSLHRTAKTPSIEKEFQFTDKDNNTYNVEAGISLKTTLDVDILRLGYGYDFLQGSNYALGFSVGLHTMLIETAFEGTIGLCVPDTELAQYCDTLIETPRVVDNSVTAPLPDFGLYGSYAFFPDWVFKAHAQYFAVKIDNIKGSLIDVRAVVEAKLNDNWSLTAGFNFYEVDVDYQQTMSVLEQEVNVANYNINYSFTGPMVSVQYQF